MHVGVEIGMSHVIPGSASGLSGDAICFVKKFLYCVKLKRPYTIAILHKKYHQKKYYSEILMKLLE